MANTPSTIYRRSDHRLRNHDKMLTVSFTRTLRGAALAAAILLPTGASAFWPFTKSNDQQFRDVCEEVLLERLKSPSSYKRISFTDPVIRKATRAEYFGWNNADDERKSQALAAANPAVARAHERTDQLFALKPNIIIVYLEYDAANSYGTMIRGIAECSLTTTRAAYEPNTLDRSLMRVNGLTHLEWAADLSR